MKNKDSDRLTRLLLIRHGATDANQQRPHILQGRAINRGLSETGYQQARALHAFLSGFDISYVYASSLVRARQTAEVIVQRRNLNVQVIDALSEVDIGDWGGKTWGQIAAEYPDDHTRFKTNPGSFLFPGGESYQDVLSRAKPEILKLLGRHIGQTIVVVSHSVVNRVLCADALNMDLDMARILQQKNACINVINGNHEKMQLVTMNASLHLEGLA